MQIRDTYRHKTLDRKTNINNKAAKVKLRIKMENFQSNPLTSDSMVISQALRDRLYALKSLHQEYIRIETAFHRDVFALNMEFQKRRQQTFEQRKIIVNGGDMADTCIDHGLSDDAVDKITESIRKMHLDDDQFVRGNGNQMPKCVPNFWLQALKNCSNELTLIQDRDNEVLTHLCDIRIDMAMDPELSFTLQFEFQANRFFHNNILTKQYILHNSAADGKRLGSLIVKAIGCSIEWKDGMNVMENAAESFFEFFNSPDSMVTDHTGMDSMEIDSNSSNELQSDFEVGSFIKDQLIPNAVLYYLNEIDKHAQAKEISVVQSNVQHQNL